MMRMLLLGACLLGTASAVRASPIEHPVGDLEQFRVGARTCHQGSPEVTGNLVVAVTIGFNGQIASAAMESRDFHDVRLVACVLELFHDRTRYVHDGSAMHMDFLKFRFRPGSSAGLLLLESGPLPAGSGEGAEQAIVRVAEEKLPVLRGCLRRHLPSGRSVALELDSRFVVGERGRVWWSSAPPRAGSAENEGLQTCVEDILRTIVVPGPRPFRLAVVDFPLYMHPDGRVLPDVLHRRVELRRQPGFLTREAVEIAVEPAWDAIAACGRMARRRDRRVGGRALVDFLIETDGRTAFVAVDSDEDAHLGDFLPGCIAEVFEGLEFPHPTHGGVVRVRWPLRFERPDLPVARPR